MYMNAVLDLRQLPLRLRKAYDPLIYFSFDGPCPITFHNHVDF